MEFELTSEVLAPPSAVYDAWLSSERHTSMTGSAAVASQQPGAEFSAWDGYIRGRNLELSRPGRIVQSWRTSDFSEDEPDSRLEVRIEATAGGTRVTLLHSGLPAHGEQYRAGWSSHYFEPMKEYFSATADG